jgi:cytoskeletal protein CcmA (bactofilin family)
VDGLLVLRNRANIEGEISTGRLQVEEGAQFSGHCKMSNFKTASPEPPKSSTVSEVEENVIY